MKYTMFIKTLTNMLMVGAMPPENPAYSKTQRQYCKPLNSHYSIDYYSIKACIKEIILLWVRKKQHSFLAAKMLHTVYDKLLFLQRSLKCCVCLQAVDRTLIRKSHATHLRPHTVKAHTAQLICCGRKMSQQNPAGICTWKL